MKQGQFVANQLQRNLQTRAGQIDTTSTSTEEPVRPTNHKYSEELRKAVAYVFLLMRDAYPQQFLNAFPDNDTRDRARGVWIAGLKDIAPKLVAKAAQKAIKENKFLPSLSDIRRLATTRDYSDYGLREPLLAYYEACRASNRTRNGVWSHIIVYLAARETGWTLLESEPQRFAFPIFERNYEILCNRLLAGEDLETSINKALENHAHLDQLRQAEANAERKLRAEMEARDIDPNGGRNEFLRILTNL